MNPFSAAGAVVYYTMAEMAAVLARMDERTLYTWLGAEELRYWQRLRFEKRRREWLAARLVLKELIRRTNPQAAEHEPAALQILKRQSGEPYLLANPPLAGSISISHSQRMVAVGYSPNGVAFGLDLEWVESRDWALVETFFTSEEIEAVHLTPLSDRDRLVTLIWSMKEAVLKALGVGLARDTRSMEVLPPDELAAAGTWQPVKVVIAGGTGQVLHAQCCLLPNYMLTAAALTPFEMVEM